MIELICGLIGALLGFIGSLLLLHFYYKQLFAQTVSSNRMEWINVWRENISKFLASTEMVAVHNCQGNESEYMKESLEAKNMVISRLNLNEDSHKRILLIMNDFNFNMSSSDFYQKKEMLLAAARMVLKPEWERVKEEAKGKRR